MKVICEACAIREPKTKGELFDCSTMEIAQRVKRNHHKYFPSHKVNIID